uniref:Retrovirus-related Pol polyprotein from transposon TNT 1-94 n=1 Tax=Tanacetum cinerariifolium TaxID=118510 RepID=A0A6L2KG56_TANCI|nr:retrovirus-related Pol polyprotein from transposon TNT 1-94 [Tanacetum cinerariifolium]
MFGIDNDIYSTTHACPNACEIWKAIERLKQEWQRFVTLVKQSQELKNVSYHKLYDILKQHQHEVNEIRAEKIAHVANPLALVAQQQPVYNPQTHPTHYNQNFSTKTQQAATENRGKEIVNSPQQIYDQEPSMVDDDDDETSKDKEIDKLMALISLSFKKIYKPTNNNLRTSSNTSRANQDNSLRIHRNTGYEHQRSGNVAGARETVGSSMVQKSRIQCYNCKEYGHVARESDWKDDTDDESDDQELEAHYMYMAKIQEVSPDVVDSGPIFDTEPEQKIDQNDEDVDLAKELNEIRAEKIARIANPLALVAQQQPVYHPQNHPTHYTQNSSTRSQQASTRNRGKAIVNSPQPIYDQEPSMVDEDDETSKDKEIDKLMALISLSFKKIYKPTNNNLRTSSNTSRANQDNSPRINRNAGYENQRIGNVVRARETVGSSVELEAHYMHMAQLQEVSLDAANSGPIYDDEPLQKLIAYVLRNSLVSLHMRFSSCNRTTFRNWNFLVYPCELVWRILETMVDKFMIRFGVNVSLDSGFLLNVITSKDHPPMLAPESSIKFTWVDKEVPISEGSPVTRTKSHMETYKTVSQDIRDQLNVEAEAVQNILT